MQKQIVIQFTEIIKIKMGCMLSADQLAGIQWGEVYDVKAASHLTTIL